MGCTALAPIYGPSSGSTPATRRFVTLHHRHGLEVIPLHQDPPELIRFERWAPRTEVVVPGTEGGLELLVIIGAFTDGTERFHKHSWLRLPPGTSLRARSAQAGCTVWIKYGHLADNRADRPVTSVP